MATAQIFEEEHPTLVALQWYHINSNNQRALSPRGRFLWDKVYDHLYGRGWPARYNCPECADLYHEKVVKPCIN